MKRRPTGDDGAYAILYALLVVILLGMASIVVDLGLLRADKRDSRGAADNAALAGARDLGLGPYSPRRACQTAWEYAMDNLSQTDPGAPCSPFPVSVASCLGVLPQTVTGAVGGVSVSITWPVPAGSSLMTNPDGKPDDGTPRPTDVAFDGSAAGCDRLGVSISRDRSLGFASALGVSQGSSYAGSVARTVLRPGDSVLPYPLVVLDKTSCDALSVNGGTVVLVKNAGDTPGRIGIDSDGTSNGSEPNSDACNGMDVVTDAAGTGSRIEAQPGASGAAAAIEVFGPSGLPARAYETADTNCTSSCLRPVPTARSERITRSPFDTLFNCGPTCPGGSAEKAYIDRFKAVALGLTGTPAGWQRITGAACNTAPPAATTTPPRFFVDCGTYEVKGPTPYSFPAGSTVVVKGDLKIVDCLVVNASGAACGTPLPAGPPYLATNGLLAVLGDVFSNGSAGKLVLPQTLLLQPLTTSRLEGSGFDLIDWTAPYVAAMSMATACPTVQPVAQIPPAACFRNLSLWTDAPSPNSAPAVVTGGGRLRLEGTFFLGEAKLKLAGGGLVDVNNAQFVAKRIEASGGSLLTFVPNPERTVGIPSLGVALVR